MKNFSLWVFILISLLVGPISAKADVCLKSMKKLCGQSKTPMKCMEQKKSSLPMKCRKEMEANKKLASQINPACIKTINSTCKLDLKKLQKDQKGYMKTYQECIVKNQKKIDKACKGIKKILDKKYPVKK